MNQRQKAIGIAIVTAILGYMLYDRSLQVDRCIAGGGTWRGAMSRCEPAPSPVIIQRELQRT